MIQRTFLGFVRALIVALLALALTAFCEAMWRSAVGQYLGWVATPLFTAWLILVWDWTGE